MLHHAWQEYSLPCLEWKDPVHRMLQCGWFIVRYIWSSPYSLALTLILYQIPMRNLMQGQNVIVHTRLVYLNAICTCEIKTRIWKKRYIPRSISSWPNHLVYASISMLVILDPCYHLPTRHCLFVPCHQWSLVKSQTIVVLQSQVLLMTPSTQIDQYQHLRFICLFSNRLEPPGTVTSCRSMRNIR